MKYRFSRAFLLVPIAGLLVSAISTASQPLGAQASGSQLTKLQKRLYLGVGPEQIPSQSSGPARAAAVNGDGSEDPGEGSALANFVPTQPGGPVCGLNRGDNVKVNQNCLNITAVDLQGRGQAHNETAIAVNPRNPDQLVGSSNDYRLGDGLAGGTSYSYDGGKTWQDSSVPVEFTRGSDFASKAQPGCPATPAGARMYWQGGGDPSVAWDSRGNVYFAGLHFNRGGGVSDNPDYSSGVYVYRSTQNGGASWSFPGTPVATCFKPTTPPNGLPLLDKPYITIDNHAGSPFRDRIYVSYTYFAPNGTATVWEAWSSDFARTFSTPVLVSATSTLCPNSVVGADNCDANQFSQPFTGPDGALYVIFDNFNNALNTAQDNRNQILIAKSTDGGQTFSAVQKVSDYYDLPDCATYQGGQDNGRACVPEKGSGQRSVFRATNYASGAVNPENPSQIAVTVGSYINKYSKESNGCVPTFFNLATGNNLYTGVKTPGACNNKILLSVSNNGGATFTGTTTDPRAMPTVNTPRQAGTDQWWQWAGFSNEGRLAVSYYDRQYGDDEFTGFMDVSLSGSRNLDDFGVERVTSSSMPVPTEFPDAQGNSLFFGDYNGLAVSNVAHPLWMDTRDPDLFDCGTPPKVCRAMSPNGEQANNQDIFTATVEIPTAEEDNGGGDRNNQR